MNKHILFLIALLCFCFACNNTDSPDQDLLSDRIIGVWDIHSFVINSCPDALNNVPLTTVDEEGCVEVFGDSICISISFNKDGTGSMYDRNLDSISDTFEYTVDEDTKFVIAYATLGGLLTFRLDGNQISLEMDEQGCICVFSFEA